MGEGFLCPATAAHLRVYGSCGISHCRLQGQATLLVHKAVPLHLPLAATSIRLLASLFLEGVITNEDAFDDQIN